jgi:hypothetical protein
MELFISLCAREYVTMYMNYLGCGGFEKLLDDRKQGHGGHGFMG